GVDHREHVFTPADRGPIVVIVFSNDVGRHPRAKVLVRPAYAVVVAPFDIEGQAGVVEESGAGAGIRTLFDDLAGGRVEREAAEARIAQAVAHAVVHAAVELQAEVARNGADPGNTAGDTVHRGLTLDQIGEEPAALGGKQVSGAEGGDDIRDLHIEVIHAEA